MPRKRRIQLVGKQAAFNAEAWARAIEALARQLQAEWQASGKPGLPALPAPKPEAKP
jgi:hypothetical protein